MVRHGQSTANATNDYTGWNDVELTQKGIDQAHEAADQIKNIDIQEVHTSVLKRAIMTAYIIQDDLDINYVPIIKSWRLNERHYGALRGQNKDVTREEYGVEQVRLWRRSYYTMPPKLAEPDPLVGPYKYLDHEQCQSQRAYFKHISVSSLTIQMLLLPNYLMVRTS